MKKWFTQVAPDPALPYQGLPPIRWKVVNADFYTPVNRVAPNKWNELKYQLAKIHYKLAKAINQKVERPVIETTTFLERPYKILASQEFASYSEADEFGKNNYNKDYFIQSI